MTLKEAQAVMRAINYALDGDDAAAMCVLGADFPEFHWGPARFDSSFFVMPYDEYVERVREYNKIQASWGLSDGPVKII